MLQVNKNKLQLNGKTLYKNSDPLYLYEVFIRLEAHINRYGEHSLDEALEAILEELKGDY